MEYVYDIRYLKGADALPLVGEFFPEALPAPWADLNEARLDQAPWGGDYRPDSRARVGWNERGLHVLMYSNEPRVRAEVTEIGGPVCTDSCLEFFVMTDPSTGLYLNCEVNPLCVTHLAVGTGRGDRVVMRTLPAGMAMTHSDHRGRWWAVSYTLPAALLADRLGKGPAAGLTIRGNFYKCGDATEAAHYCMFKPYDTEKPDYHRPEQFAEMRLIGE